jgi:hypothetical protein
MAPPDSASAERRRRKPTIARCAASEAPASAAVGSHAIARGAARVGDALPRVARVASKPVARPRSSGFGNLLATLPSSCAASTPRSARRRSTIARCRRSWCRAVAPTRVRGRRFPREDISRDEAALLRFADTTVSRVPTATGIALTNVESARAVMGAFREALLGAALAITLLLLVLWRRGPTRWSRWRRSRSPRSC